MLKSDILKIRAQKIMFISHQGPGGPRNPPQEIISKEPMARQVPQGKLPTLPRRVQSNLYYKEHCVQEHLLPMSRKFSNLLHR